MKTVSSYHLSLEKLGYTTEDVYEQIRAQIKTAALFRFDWFFKSRTSAELMRRCQSLIGMVHKEAGTYTHSLEEDGRKNNSGPVGKRGKKVVKG
jgi:SLIDE